MNTRSLRRIGSVLLAACAAAAGLAGAQDFPSRPIRMIIPYGPGGMPANATDRLFAATAKALQRPEVSKRLTAMGAEVVGGTPAQMGAHLKSEMDRWIKLAREVKFELAD